MRRGVACAGAAAALCLLVPGAAWAKRQAPITGKLSKSGYTVIAPVGSDFRPDDQVRIRGELYAVIGEPGEYPVKKGKPGVFVTTERVARTGT